MPVYSLSLHITTSLLETSLARAIHRFIIEDEEEGTSMLVVSRDASKGQEKLLNLLPAALAFQSIRTHFQQSYRIRQRFHSECS